MSYAQLIILQQHDDAFAIFLEFSLRQKCLALLTPKRVIVSLQYYYAHANKNFSTEGAKHFKEDGKIYGGDPVLIKTYSQDEKASAQAAVPTVETKKITKFSWGDEEAKVKVYIETN